MIEFLLDEITKIMSSIPAFEASITAHSITGLSRTISISFGIDFVAGKNLVPKPAIGNIAFFMGDIRGEVNKKIKKTQPKRISLASFNFLVIQSDPPKSG